MKRILIIGSPGSGKTTLAKHCPSSCIILSFIWTAILAGKLAGDPSGKI